MAAAAAAAAAAKAGRRKRGLFRRTKTVFRVPSHSLREKKGEI